MKFHTVLAFLFMLGSMVVAATTGHPLLAFLMFLATVGLVMWAFMRPSSRPMTVAEREAQADRCGGWDFDSNED